MPVPSSRTCGRCQASADKPFQTGMDYLSTPGGIAMKKKALIPLLLLAAAVAATAQSPTDLLLELKKGGYVLFIRHPRTNPDQADTDPLNLDNIKAQRQLSDDGRKQAKALGESFRALGIP